MDSNDSHQQNAAQIENDYLFDLHGYRIIKGALSPDEVRRINAWIDEQQNAQPPRETGEWIGDVEVHSYQGHDGTNYQNIVEGGAVFEELIDHPSWIDDVRRTVCNDYHGLSINECFLNVREQSGFIGIHSGGHLAAFQATNHSIGGQWMVGQINVLMALTDIGAGDGATTIVPGSHKSHEVHPALRDGKQNAYNDDIVAGQQLGMTEVHLRAGDALMFTDGLCHGSAARTNAGQRRICIYRYSPHLMIQRFNYVASDELLERLTPARRKILQPIPPRLAPGRILQS